MGISQTVILMASTIPAFVVIFWSINKRNKANKTAK